MICLTITFGYALQWAMVTAIVCYAVWAAVRRLLFRRRKGHGGCGCGTPAGCDDPARDAECAGCPLADKCTKR